MRFASAAVATCLSLIFSVSLFGQQPPATTPQAAQLVQRALSTAMGAVAVKDVTLTGTARRIAGSDDETGSATLQALATGETRMDSSFPSGPRSEIRWTADKHLKGQWTGPDGISQTIPPHNLMVDPAWFFPPLLLRRISSSQDFVVSHAGSESRDERAVEHLSAFRPFTLAPGGLVPMLQHATQVEVYLDSVTLLPSALTFNTHPDNDASRDLPVEIRYSDYRAVNGVQVPFHVQKFLNNSLVLELQFQTVVLNTGLSPSAFTAQQSLKGDAQ